MRVMISLSEMIWLPYSVQRRRKSRIWQVTLLSMRLSRESSRTFISFMPYSIRVFRFSILNKMAYMKACPIYLMSFSIRKFRNRPAGDSSTTRFVPACRRRNSFCPDPSPQFSSRRREVSFPWIRWLRTGSSMGRKKMQ